MSDHIKAILTELRDRFQGLYGERLVQMVLFGSQARGDAEDGSDIDVLVVLKGEVNPCEEIERAGDIVYDISFKNEVVVSCVYVDEDRYFRRNGPLMRNIRREGVSL